MVAKVKTMGTQPGIARTIACSLCRHLGLFLVSGSVLCRVTREVETETRHSVRQGLGVNCARPVATSLLGAPGTSATVPRVATVCQNCGPPSWP